MHLFLNVLKSETVDEAESDVARRNAIDRVMSDDLAEIDAETLPVHFEQHDLEEALELHSGTLTQSLQEQFHGHRQVGDVSFSCLSELAIKLLIKRYSQYMEKTGIVFAGFGDSDYFPTYIAYDCFGFLCGRLMCDEVEQSIDRNAPSYIKPFATTAMVNTFLFGFSPDVLSSVQNETRLRFEDLIESVSKEHGIEVGDSFIQHVEETLKQHTDNWISTAYQNHAQPLMRIIGSLPVDEMAELAETLIMLESLKEKVTRPTESVGGPIDVCVISKSDGFVWIKRKHYFEQVLNPHYFSRQSVNFGDDYAG